jgi:3-hydroxybutyryl-CoA dehydratase
MLDNQPRGTICIEDIEMGMTRYIRKVVTDKDIEMFAEVSTDRNPSAFGRRIRTRYNL